jgi:hypothetical protein
MEKTKMRKIVLTAIALSTLAGTSAMAAPARHQPVRADQAIAAQRGNVVIVDGTVVGQDPDANVRLELLRSAGSENQG